MTFDELRAAHPELGFAVYAMEPKGFVTFEVHTPDGQVYSFTGATQQAAIDEAFPPTRTPYAWKQHVVTETGIEVRTQQPSVFD